MAENPCAFCGIEPYSREDHERYNGAWEWTGIDRIDNSKGYLQGNIQACCGLCNRLKSDMGEKEFLSHIAKVFHRRVGSIKED